MKITDYLRTQQPALVEQTLVREAARHLYDLGVKMLPMPNELYCSSKLRIEKQYLDDEWAAYLAAVGDPAKLVTLPRLDATTALPMMAEFAEKYLMWYMARAAGVMERKSFVEIQDREPEVTNRAPYSGRQISEPVSSEDAMRWADDARMARMEAPVAVTKPAPDHYLLGKLDANLTCGSDHCRFNRVCANHASAGDYRSDDGASPRLKIADDGLHIICTSYRFTTAPWEQHTESREEMPCMPGAQGQISYKSGRFYDTAGPVREPRIDRAMNAIAAACKELGIVSLNAVGHTGRWSLTDFFTDLRPLLEKHLRAARRERDSLPG